MTGTDDLGPARFTAQQYADFADEIAARGEAFAKITGHRPGVVMAHAAAQAIRNLAPGGRAEQAIAERPA